MTYQPIEDYGVIGNMHTVALVSKNASIDWFCPTRFDDPSIFARLLDDDKGGYFCIQPPTDATTKQYYWTDTNILVTRFLCEEGIAEITDYMPVGISEEQQANHWLIREVKMVRGVLPLRVECAPAFNYARDDHTVRIDDNGICFDSETASFSLSASVDFHEEDGVGVAEFWLEQGEQAIFSLRMSEAGEAAPPPLSQTAEDRDFLTPTVRYWRDWLSQCTYKGRWREMVYRSALAMKLLTHEPTGAIVAAPTTSLPESIGGVRNWDYRYSWLRDSAFTLYGFLRIGFTEEAGAFIDWLQERIHESEPQDGEMPLQIMYTIDGDPDIPERHLDHLEGYRESTPVRVGNAAHEQLQLDVFGELMDSIYLYNKYGEKISYELWNELSALMDWVVDNWQRHDQGIWEVRGVDQPFVYSKLMCWVALDRAVRLADKRSFPAPRAKWLNTRDAIYREIMDHGWNDDLHTFTQYYDGDTLDASNLIMPLVFFISPTDPRMIQTIDAVMQPPEQDGLLADSLVYRYNTSDGVDGLSGDEGTFNMCTFWLVEALTRCGRIDDARRIFERMLAYANHVGLYAEETGPRGEALGNFPQAFTHLSLISSAYNLDLALNGEKWKRRDQDAPSSTT